jgi:TonB family protein
LVITCVLDRSGGLKNLQVLESSASELTRQVMAALPSWKFRPAMRGDQPVEVNAILGFGVDTNDRF